jgi:LacI family transcriptional regulator
MDAAHREANRSIPKVAVLLETTNTVRRDLVLGISQYARINGPWSLYVGECKFDNLGPKMTTWGAHGIIARVPNARVGRALVEAGFPAVAICTRRPRRNTNMVPPKLSNVTFDAADHVAELALQHFADRRFTHFAFVGLKDSAWSEKREIAFTARLRSAGFRPHSHRRAAPQQDRGWEREQETLTKWIISLPKPVGILACNDEQGRYVLECCRLANLAVPEQVAVLGVDNDEVFCNMADPPLSSVALDAQKAGYEVAQLLDGIMRGAVRKPQEVAVKALGVVTRQSTDIVAVRDDEVAAALRFIHSEDNGQISVDDVARNVIISRRGLEKRFRNMLGRTIHEEIQLVRLDRAKRLLLETDHTLSEVAQRAGFGTLNYFHRFFQQRMGRSPKDFRGQRPAANK